MSTFLGEIVLILQDISDIYIYMHHSITYEYFYMMNSVNTT